MGMGRGQKERLTGRPFLLIPRGENASVRSASRRPRRRDWMGDVLGMRFAIICADSRVRPTAQEVIRRERGDCKNGDCKNDRPHPPRTLSNPI